MTQSDRRTSLDETAHYSCPVDASLGWAMCLTAWHVGLAAHAHIGNRIRVAVAESGNQLEYEPVISQLHTAAVRLAVEGYSARRSVSLLSRVLARMRNDSGPGPSLVLLDLHESGYVDTASLNAPSVLHVTRAQRPLHIKPIDLSDVESTIVAAGDGDAVLALSSTAAQDIAPDVVSSVTSASSFSDPCTYRDELVRFTDTKAQVLPAPPMAVLFRRA